MTSPIHCPSSPLLRTLTELDHVRLSNLLRRDISGPLAAQVADVIDNADLVPSASIDADIVTMRSRVRLCDTATGAERTLTLSYPDAADAAQGSISVLSPIGMALLGRRTGDVAEWHGAGGQATRARIVAVEYQPEASGEYTT